MAKNSFDYYIETSGKYARLELSEGSKTERRFGLELVIGSLFKFLSLFVHQSC